MFCAYAAAKNNVCCCPVYGFFVPVLRKVGELSALGCVGFAFFNHFARVEQNALKAVISRILFCRRAAVSFDYEILVSHIIIVHIVPAESVHINLSDTSWDCNLI